MSAEREPEIKRLRTREDRAFLAFLVSVGYGVLFTLPTVVALGEVLGRYGDTLLGVILFGLVFTGTGTIPTAWSLIIFFNAREERQQLEHEQHQENRQRYHRV